MLHRRLVYKCPEVPEFPQIRNLRRLCYIDDLSYISGTIFMPSSSRPTTLDYLPTERVFFCSGTDRTLTQRADFYRACSHPKGYSLFTREYHHCLEDTCELSNTSHFYAPKCKGSSDKMSCGCMGGETFNTQLDFSVQQPAQIGIVWTIHILPIGLIIFMSLGTYFQHPDATAGRFAGFAGSMLSLITASASTASKQSAHRVYSI
jgi:hypothetical protein